MERVWQRDYATHGEAQHDITNYIMSFYNGSRLHSKLGYLSPPSMDGNGSNTTYPGSEIT
ncbi:hypothetical protein SAMN05216404_10587 [Nitrosospira multiformis]|uniref:Integrase-like protein n=1 Tax=Nitrosospira multiformis TaxID=1231 RepID=A0A1H8HAZ6_9PROT|nr:hypothetical protein SAMN05216404_10587 [Nitrosospira multiformis]